MVFRRFDILDSLLLCGIIQGMVVSFLVLTGKRRLNISSYFLSGTLLIFTFYNVLVLAYDINFFASFPSLLNIPINFIWGFGPCIYFYIYHSVRQIRPRGKWWVHFIPVCIQFCYYFILFRHPISDYLSYNAWKRISEAEQIIALLSVCIYTCFSLKLLNAYRTQAVNADNKSKFNMGNWLYKLLSAYIVLWVIWLAYTLTDILHFDWSLPLRSYFPIYLLVAGLTYWIGVMAYLHPAVIASNVKSAFNGLEEDEITDKLHLLQKAMIEKKLYRNPDLNLKLFARHAGVNANLVSFILNNKVNKSFNEWVNTYRVDEVKKSIIDPKFNHITLTGIAYDCGFNSKATFNRVFKAQTGTTPKEYTKKRIQK